MEETVLAHGGHDLPLGTGGEGGRPLHRGEDQIRIARRHSLDAHNAGGRGHIGEEVLAAGALHQLAQEASPPDGHGGLFPHEEQHLGSSSWSWPGCGGQGGIEYSSDRVGGSFMPGELTEDPRHPGDTAQGVGVDPERCYAQLAEPAGDGGVLAGVVEHHQIRPLGDHRFDVGLDAVAQIGNGFGGGGIVAIAGPSYDGRIGADGKEQLGRGRNERDDSPSRRGEPDRVACIVDQTDAAASTAGACAARGPVR